MGSQRGAECAAALAARPEAGLRLFAAVDVPESRRRSIVSAIAGLRPDLPSARWTGPDSWHATLKFFGEVPDDRVPELAGRIRAVASTASAVESRLEEIGAFPNMRRARVLWVGVADPASALKSLARSIEQGCGYPPEDRFKAHLTLARFKVPGSIGDVIDRHGPFEWDRSPFAIDKVTLYRSVLSRQGARYTPLAEFPLRSLTS